MPLAQSCWAWYEMKTGSDLWYWGIVIKNDKRRFKVLDEHERKAKIVIEFCGDKCLNVIPHCMQLAVGFFWMRNNNEGGQEFVKRLTEDLHLQCYDHSVSNPACIFNQDSTGFSHGVCLLGMPAAFILHINIRFSAQRARGSLCCKAVWWNKDRHRRSQEEEEGKSKYRRQRWLST